MDLDAGLRALLRGQVSAQSIAIDMRRILEDLRGARTHAMTLSDQWRRPLSLLYLACMAAHDENSGHQDIERTFSTMQSDCELQETLMLSCYSTGNWVESFQLAKDLLATRPSLLAFQTALHLACNRFFMPQYALHVATRACEAFPEFDDFKYAKAVALSLCGDAAVYYTEKTTFLELAATDFLSVQHPKKSLHLALVYAQIGDYDAALHTASLGLLDSDSAELSALLALIKLRQEDFTEADAIVHNGLIRHRGNVLLHTVALLIQHELHQLVKNNTQAVERRIKRLLRLLAGESVDDVSSNGTEDKQGGLAPIEEESGTNLEVDSQDDFKTLKLDLENAEVKTTVELCIRVLIESEAKEAADTLLHRLTSSQYLHSLFEYRFGQKPGSELVLIQQLEGLPENAWAQELLSHILFTQGRKDQAMTAAKLSLKLGGPRRLALTIVGNLYLEAGLRDKAAETALAALQSRETYFEVIPKWL